MPPFTKTIIGYMDDEHRPWIRISSDGKRIDYALLDTGASYSILTKHFADKCSKATYLQASGLSFVGGMRYHFRLADVQLYLYDGTMQIQITVRAQVVTQPPQPLSDDAPKILPFILGSHALLPYGGVFLEASSTTPKLSGCHVMLSEHSSARVEWLWPQ